MKTEISMSLTERAVSELSQFNDMIAHVLPYAELTVAEAGIGQVTECRKAVKRLRLEIEAKRKELKAGALEYGRTVDSIAKQLTAKVEHVEGKLTAEEERYEESKLAEKRAKEQAAAARKQERVNQMIAAGVTVE